MATSAVPTPTEIRDTTSLLEQTRVELLTFCAGLQTAGWGRSDGDGRWTVAQILEHLVMVEQLSLRVFDAALAAGPDADWAAKTLHKDALLPKAEVVVERVSAPEILHPGPAPDPDKLLDAFRAARQATIELAQRPGMEWKKYVRTHPVFGPVNLLQNLRLLGHHTRRHLAQMRGCLR